MSEFDSSITAYFGGDTTGLNKAVGDAGQTLQKFSDKVADKVVGMRDLSNAVATALGINVENIANNIAGLFTSMTDEAKEAYKKIEDLSTQAADQNIAAMRKLTSLQNQHALAVQDQEKTQQKINELHERENKLLERQSDIFSFSGPFALELLMLFKKRELVSKTVVELAEKEQELVKKTSEVAATTTELKTRNLELDKQKATFAANEEIHTAQIYGYEAMRAALAHNLAEAKEAEAKALQTGVDIGAKLLEAQKARFALDDLELKHKQQIAGSAAEEYEVLLLTHKVAMGIATGPEELRLKIIKMQREERGILLELTDLENKSIAGELTPAEKKRFDELVKQEKKLTDQLTTLEKQEQQLKINAEIAILQAKVLDGTINPAEKERLELLIAQGKALNKQVEDSDKLVVNLQKVANTYGRTDKDLSDRELAEKLGNLKKQYQGAVAAGDTGSFFFQQKIAEVEFEIGRRAGFRKDYQMKGEKAFNDFSAFDEQYLRNLIRPEDEARAQQQADNIRELNQNFKDLFKKGG